MVNLKLKKNLISRTTGVGRGRIKLNPNNLDDIAGLDAKADVRYLIAKGIITISPLKGQVRRKKIRRRRGVGSKKGKSTSKITRKDRWITKVRSQRKAIRNLRDLKKINPTEYCKLYIQIKGGLFKSKAHIYEYINMKMRNE